MNISGGSAWISNTELGHSNYSIPTVTLIRAASSSPSSVVRLSNVQMLLRPFSTNVVIGLQWISGTLNVDGLNIEVQAPFAGVRGIVVPATNTTSETAYLNNVHIENLGTAANTSTGILHASTTAAMQIYGATVHNLGNSLAQTGGTVQITHSVLSDAVTRTAGTLRCGLVTNELGTAITCP